MGVWYYQNKDDGLEQQGYEILSIYRYIDICLKKESI